jgi:hypothetical protein
MIRACIYLGPAVALAGVILTTVFAPRTKADDYDTPRTHVLWVCESATSCKPEGPPKNSTACALDLAAKANTMPKGTRLYCARVDKP